MNGRLETLHAYPFERLGALTGSLRPPIGVDPIRLSIGEPRHPPPAFVVEALADVQQLTRGLGTYPATRGTEALREAIVRWATQRFDLAPGKLAPDAVLPVAGTREGLFAFAQAVVDQTGPGARPVVAMPNPFYQIYEGAALLAGAEPVYVPCPAERDFLPAFDAVDAATWARCQLLYLCSPGNPSGSVMDLASWREVFDLADRFDFVIAADECYSELYDDESAPPLGLLEACERAGRPDFARCVVFHSLSKRSNLPGLRSGFVAGDASLIRQFLRYRTYHGCAMPEQVQTASALAWSDEHHVVANRAMYRAKFDAVLDLLAPVMDVRRPTAGFYLWAATPGDEEAFTRDLYAATGVLVLPGRYLSRPTAAGDPGTGRVRMALVADLEDCVTAAQRLRRFLETA
jgi:N-succinyldiaminopimelate aminotransferase